MDPHANIKKNPYIILKYMNIRRCLVDA